VYVDLAGGSGSGLKQKPGQSGQSLGQNVLYHYFYYVFVNLVFWPRLYPTFELSGPYQHIWMISHDFRLSQLQHPRNRQQHARLCHNRGNRRRQVYKGTLIISIFYNYYHLMKNNPEHDKKGSKTLISRDEGRLHPPPPCRRSKKETEGDLHATRSLHLSF